MANEAPLASTTMSSRLRRAAGSRSTWQIDDEVAFELPVILDFRIADTTTGDDMSVTEATIDLRDGVPAIVRMEMSAEAGIDVVFVQREFRWAGPLEVITRIVPELIRRGVDPFEVEYPVSNLPEATHPVRHRRLSHEFLEDVSREYLVHGRGYSKVLADKYQVSARTVMSWIEKARERGILTATRRGAIGGSLANPRTKNP